jgi:tight adherence protein B
MVGALVGLVAATGILLIASGWLSPSPRAARAPRLAGMLADAGVARLTPSSLIAASMAAAMVATVLVASATGLVVAAVLAGGAAAVTPMLLVRRRARTRMEAVRSSWPDAVDALASGVRAGLGLPEATAALAVSGPDVLRPLFSASAIEYRATGSFDAALAVLAGQARDGVADRVVAALRLGREVGGGSVGEVLRTLAAMLREDSRIRSEIRGRQSWTVSAARMAVVAPWLTLLLLSTRPEAVAAFATPAGAAVLVLAAAMSVLAYALMLRVSRLPELPRLAS